MKSLQISTYKVYKKINYEKLTNYWPLISLVEVKFPYC